jgi:hypothetical protein
MSVPTGSTTLFFMTVDSKNLQGRIFFPGRSLQLSKKNIQVFKQRIDSHLFRRSFWSFFLQNPDPQNKLNPDPENNGDHRYRCTRHLFSTTYLSQSTVEAEIHTEIIRKVPRYCRLYQALRNQLCDAALKVPILVEPRVDVEQRAVAHRQTFHLARIVLQQVETAIEIVPDDRAIDDADSAEDFVDVGHVGVEVRRGDGGSQALLYLREWQRQVVQH